MLIPVATISTVEILENLLAIFNNVDNIEVSKWYQTLTKEWERLTNCI